MNKLADLLDLPIESLGKLSPRLLTCLTSPTRGQGLDTVRQVVALTPRDLTRIPGMGTRTIMELLAALEARGLRLAEPDKDGHPPLPLFPTVHQRLAGIEARLAALENLVTTGHPIAVPPQVPPDAGAHEQPPPAEHGILRGEPEAGTNT